MGDKSAISWCDATWNPSTGCTRVSPGCDHCFAFALHDQRHLAWKRGTMPNAAPQYHKPYSQVQLFPDRLDLPLRWKQPRKIFVDSMTDLFHEDVSDDFIDQVFATMRRAKRHTFQLLTKRAERMQRYVARAETRIHKLAPPRPPSHWYHATDWTWPLPNVWLGVSAEDQQRADERIPLLLQTPAAVRFVSAEPLLGLIDFTKIVPPTVRKSLDAGGFIPSINALTGLIAGPDEYLPGRAHLNWVITGGESGPHARPADPQWFRDIRDQCQAAGVAYFHKQQGGRRPGGDAKLDGRLWHEFPQTCQPVSA